ncbi:CPBP family intramembrane glutamic endopeptidase [Salidesulfovibrio onnuriiensis]|uniref:CPBP family intramembrane glutamic endopeptidase n=1 Tax=Salidesulfovibrio onnuriiensis TaxID=2583823 RepID=UPI0011C744D1|nr:CPBP family intramembrane glutamic endopeptidase [Salidesulfovibrio onnuriiensis]
MRWKPILLFLAITFALTWGVEILLIARGLGFRGVLGTADMLSLVACMWIPGLCALAVHRLVEKRPVRELGLRFGSWKGYALAVAIVPLAYVAIFGLTWLLGLGAPDWQLRALTDLQPAGQEVDIASIYLTVLPASIFLGPVINLLPALGEELGWRGFLLPRFMGLGKLRAYLLLGLVWGLWHAPLIWVGFNYPGYPVLGILMMVLGCTAFGALFNEMTLQYGSVFLAAFLHAALNSQGYGIWNFLFPDVNPMLGGDTGLTGLFVWSLLALWAVRTFRVKANPS